MSNPPEEYRRAGLRTGQPARTVWKHVRAILSAAPKHLNKVDYVVEIATTVMRWKKPSPKLPFTWLETAPATNMSSAYREKLA